MEPPDENDLACHVGRQYGSYRIERRIGKGGMGEVFAARHIDTGEYVALKTLSRHHPTQYYRFKREFRALADVHHPNLIRLGELVIADRGPSFFTMELLDGESFTSWARRGTPVAKLPDLERLRAGLRQLVEGLECLHGKRCVHRDLKPSNIMVTCEDRVVILDFGIIAESSESDRGMTRDGQVLGTPIYMAPEQAQGQRAGPPADFYAIGVILYECLTGKPPFNSFPLVKLLDKQADTTADPGSEIPEIPPMLRELCVNLLHRDPSRRPTGPQLLVRLGGRDARPRPVESMFVGRQVELGQLRTALANVRARGRAVTVCVRGRSGHGKSTLLREFVGETQRESELIVLRGRCRERETLPYKGVDAVVDALGVYVRRLDEAERLALRPKYVGVLARVFPVLDEIWEQDPYEQISANPHETRSLGWASLRDLLTRLSARGQLLVIINDFQWADRDSVEILRAMTRGPEAPPMLLAITVDDAQTDMLGRDVADEFDERDVRRIELGALPELEARKLALSLLRARMDPDAPLEPGPLQARAEAIALRCGGSPFFINQMVLGGEGISSGADLADLVVHRLEQLDPPARRLLEVVAVSGGPLAQSLAIELSGETGEERLVMLCELGLLVRSEAGADPVVEAAHDRIREICLAGLTAEQRRALHWAIGERLLARDGSDPTSDRVFAIADHFDAGLSLIDSLSATRRLELAQLQARAGERALEAAAWTSARRYLMLGYRLAQPWLDQARRGEGPRELCLALAFGRAQVEAMAKSETGDAAFDDLMEWSLPVAEIGRIVARRVVILRRVDRMSAALDVGLAGLGRLGLKLPRNPSIVWGIVAVLRGWFTLGRRSLEALRALPEANDELLRARLDVMVELSRPAYLVSQSLYIMMAGYVTRTIHRNGYHGSAIPTLVRLAVSVGYLGKGREAGELCDRALALGNYRSVRPLELLTARVLSFLVLPTSRPFSKLMSDIEPAYRECCSCDLFEAAGYAAVGWLSLSFWTDAPLSDIADKLTRFEALNPGFGSTFSGNCIAAGRRNVRRLSEGTESALPEEVDELIVRYLDMFYQMALKIQLCDYQAAAMLRSQIPADYEKVMLGNLTVPALAMYSAILEAQRWPLASARERWRSLRAIRRFAKTTRRWATQGPENFGPMADIVAGEIAALRGQIDQAMATYERARMGAMANRSHALVGLACMRLARLAHRRGHKLMAEPAFESALTTYEVWGATALVTRLREIGIEGV